jgi:hypothetical protein
VAAFAEDTAQHLGDGEDELAVGDFVADCVGDPLANGAGAALVAGGAEVSALAGESEEAFVAAIRALVTGKAGGEVAATEKGLDGGDGGRVLFLWNLERFLVAIVLPFGTESGWPRFQFS